MKNNFTGIILQPISNEKEPWSGFNNEKDFLTYFQNTFKKEIGDQFYVNHNTEDFSDYLLIPYYTDNKKCFGAYYIDYGSKIKSDCYSYSYHIDYTKSFNFIKEVFNYEILEEIDFNQGTVDKVANDNRTFYYRLENLSNEFKKYMISVFDEHSII